MDRNSRPAAAVTTTRRGLLAAAGASALAGCTALDGLGSDEQTIELHTLPDVDEEAAPPVVVSVPVTVTPAHFADATERVTSTLAELPTPFGPSAIPNGHVRQDISHAADTATDELDDARDAPTELVALLSLQTARAHAGYAAAGWAAADRGLATDPLAREHDELVSTARETLSDHEYVGADPVRATLVHARIEESLTAAVEDEPYRGEQSRVLAVAEWGEAVESARASLDDARHLAAQFDASLPDDAGTVTASVSRAAETLLAEVRAAGSELPPEPTADEWGLAERVVDELRGVAADGPRQVGEATGPAGAVLDANRRLTQFRAIDRVRERATAGDLSRPDSGEAVRATRTRAYDAFETALAESTAPGLTRTAVVDAAGRVAYADRELARVDGDVDAERLDSVVGDYVLATAVCRAAPAVSGRVAEALTGG